MLGRISSAKETQVRSLQEFAIGGKKYRGTDVLNIPGLRHDLSQTSHKILLEALHFGPWRNI